MVVIYSSLCLISGISFIQPAQGGKYPYPELLPRIDFEIIEILLKHGMHVQHNSVPPWVKISGVPGNYTIYFYLADEIPQAAKLDAIRFFMDLYEERGWKEHFRIKMYRETHAEKIRWFSGVKPFFEMTIKGND